MRVLLVEDDADLAAALAAALRVHGYAMDHLASGREADTALRAQSFDLVVLDLNLPGQDGFTVLRNLRARHDRTPVLVLSARDETADRVRALDLGADDYLTKPFELAELEARIRALLRRAHGAAHNLVELNDLALDTAARRVSVAGRPIDLTAREYAVLEKLVLRAGHVVAKDALLDGLTAWGEEMSHGALEIHIHRIRRKLEGAHVTLRTLRGFGYLLEAKA